MQSIGEVFYSIGDFFGGFGKNSQKRYFNQRMNFQINEGKVQLNTMIPYKLYNSIPQIKIPIDKLAAMFANGVFKYQKIGSTELLDLPPDIAKLLENPNILQGQNPFMKQYLKQLLIYGNQYIYKNQPSKTTAPKTLTCISPAFMSPVLTGKVFDQIDMNGIVKNYEYTENGQIKPFKTQDVLWSKIDDLDNPVLGLSPLMGLQFPISNTELAYKYLNVISGSRGHIGILSYEGQKDSMGPIPQTTEEREEIERVRKDRSGVEDNQSQTLITSAPVKYTPTSYPTGELLLLEQIDANALTILDTFGVNRNLFNNSTYENLRHGLMSTHNDTVQPYADGFTQLLSKFIGVQEGYKIILDYSHLPYLQTDKKTDADTFSVVSNAINSLVSAGIVDVKQANNILANQYGVKVS